MTESQHFLNIFWKNIEKFCNIAKFRKGKNVRVPKFSSIKFLDGHASYDKKIMTRFFLFFETIVILAFPI